MTQLTNHNSFCAKFRTLLSIWLLAGLVVCVRVTAQDRLPETAQFNVQVDGYVNVFYDQAPQAPAQWVFYRGEIINGFVQLLNPPRSSTMDLRTPSGISFIAEWTAYPAPRGPTRPQQPEPNNKIQVEGPDGIRVVFPGQDVTLSAPGIVSSGFTLDTAQMTEGIYQIAFRPVDWQTDRRISLDHNVMTFEIRQTDSTQRALDALARRAQRAIFLGDLQDATTAVNQMLARYGNSALAFNLRGQIATRAGRQTEASQAFANAARLVRERSDDLYETRPEKGIH
jgi:hypothetical protein